MQVFRFSQCCNAGIWSSGMWCYTTVLVAPSIPLKCWESINSNAALHCRILNLQFILYIKVDGSWVLDLCERSYETPKCSLIPPQRNKLLTYIHSYLFLVSDAFSCCRFWRHRLREWWQQWTRGYHPQHLQLLPYVWLLLALGTSPLHCFRNFSGNWRILGNSRYAHQPGSSLL